jgi:hypothetical protein
MVNYSNGKIYKIVCDTTKLVYIGSTTKRYLSQRLGNHRSSYNAWIDEKTYQKTKITSFKVLENNNYSIILLESVDCKTKDELLARERFYIETVECVNTKNPKRVRTEYYLDNRDLYLQKGKDYYQDNKEFYTKKCDCECGGKYTSKNKPTHLKTKRHLDYLAELNSSGI